MLQTRRPTSGVDVGLPDCPHRSPRLHDAAFASIRPPGRRPRACRHRRSGSALVPHHRMATVELALMLEPRRGWPAVVASSARGWTTGAHAVASAGRSPSDRGPRPRASRMVPQGMSRTPRLVIAGRVRQWLGAVQAAMVWAVRHRLPLRTIVSRPSTALVHGRLKSPWAQRPVGLLGAPHAMDATAFKLQLVACERRRQPRRRDGAIRLPKPLRMLALTMSTWTNAVPVSY